MAKTTKTVPQCCAQVQRHHGTTIQRIAYYKTGGCTRKGVVTMRRKVGGLPSDFGLWSTDDPDLQHVADNFKHDLKIRRDAEVQFRRNRDRRRWG